MVSEVETTTRSRVPGQKQDAAAGHASQKWRYLPWPSERMVRFNGSEGNNGSQPYPHAHVEGDDGDTDIFSCFSVHIRQLQPGMILLLPRTQRVPCDKWRHCREWTEITIGKLLNCHLSDRAALT